LTFTHNRLIALLPAGELDFPAIIGYQPDLLDAR
jgi:hypothetical protein